MPGSRPRPVLGFFVRYEPIYNSAVHTAKKPLISPFLSYRSLRAVRDGQFAGGMANYRRGVYVVELGSCERLGQKPVNSTRRRLCSFSHGPTRQDITWEPESLSSGSRQQAYAQPSGLREYLQRASKDEHTNLKI